MQWVIEQTDLTGSDHAVLVALAFRAGKDSDACWPSLPKLAADSHASVSTVQRSLLRLQSFGLVHVKPKGGPAHDGRKDRRPNLYTLIINDWSPDDLSSSERLVKSESTTSQIDDNDWSAVTTEGSLRTVNKESPISDSLRWDVGVDKSLGKAQLAEMKAKTRGKK
jgi:hypothetical protein